MGIGPFTTYAPPGVYTSTTVQPAGNQLIGGLRVPVIIGTGKESLSQTNFEIIRGSSSVADTPIFGEDVYGHWVSGGTSQNPLLGNQDGSKTKFRVRNFPIVDGLGSGTVTYNPAKLSVSVNDQEVVVSAVDGANGIVTILVAPTEDDVVTVHYYFHRKDTQVTDDVSSQITVGSAVLVAPRTEGYTITSGSNDVFTVTPNDGISYTVTLTSGVDRSAENVALDINTLAIPGITASVHIDANGQNHLQLVALGNILIGSGSANGVFGFTPGDYTNRNKSFRVFQGPVVDGSDGGITTTDPSKVTVLVDGSKVTAKTVDGTNRLVTLSTAPRYGQTITITYWFNTFQDTFDYLPNTDVINMGNVGISPDRRDYINGVDFVIINESTSDGAQSKIQWGTAFQVESGVQTGSVPFDSTKIVGSLIDNRMYGVECERYTDTSTLVVSTTKFVLPLKPTTGNGRDTPLGISVYQTISNGRMDLPTNRPDLVEVHVGKTWRDAVSRPAVTVLEVDSSTNIVTLKDVVPADYNAYATFWYNRMADDQYTLSVVSPGVSGVGTYKIASRTLGTNLYGVKFGTKSGLSQTIQWPSGSESVPDAFYDGSGSPVSETVTITFATSLDPATHASFTNKNQEPYDIYNYSRVFGNVVVDGGSPVTVDLSIPHKAILVGQGVNEPLSLLTTDRLLITVDGVTLAPVNISACTTLAQVATAINAVVDADTQVHADGSGTFLATAPNSLASASTYGTQAILSIKGRSSPSFTNGLVSSVLVSMPTASGQTDGSVKVGLGPNQSSVGSYNAINQVATIVGTNAEPFIITAGVNDTVQINVDGVDVSTVLPSGSAVSLANVVIAINDAYVQYASVADIATLTTDVISLANELKGDYNTHRVSTVYHVAADSTNIVSLADATTLSTAIALLNQIKAKVNLHLSQSGVHQLDDSINVISAADATNIQTAVHLANVIKEAYNLHLSQLGVHGHDDITNVLASLTPPAVADDCKNILNDIKAKYGSHRIASGSHLTNDTVNTVSAADSTDASGGPYTTGIALANNLKSVINAHFIQTGIHAVNDATNTIVAADATDASTLVTLTTELQSAYEDHLSQLQGIYHVHGKNDAVNTTASSMHEMIANTGLGINAGKLVLTSRINTVNSSLVIKNTGTANDVLGFTPGASAQRHQPTASDIAAALNISSSFAAVAVAYRVQVAGLGGYLRIDSRTTGLTSIVAFSSIANTAFIADTGLGITPGTSGDVGEGAKSGFTVASSAGTLGSHGTGFPGQTYTDALTGLKFTVLPASAGDYSDGGSFTLVSGQTFTTDASIPIRALSGVELTVFNTYNTSIDTTALVNTYVRSGAEPEVGSFYYVSYDYAKTNLTTALFRDSKKIYQSFGNPTIDNPISLAARLSQLNGAILIGLKQVLRSANQSQASVSAYTAAIDEQKKPISGSVKPDVIVPLTTESQVFSYLNQHCIFMNSPRQEGERIGVVGVAAGTTPLGVQAIAKGLNSELMIVTYPDSFVVSIQDAQNNTVDQLVDGTYCAAALAGSLTNPVYDVASPITRRAIVGFKQLGRILDPTEANQIAVAGVSIIEQTGAGLRVRHGLTTNVTSVIKRTPSVQLTIQYVQQTVRRVLDPFIGQKLTGLLIKSAENALVGGFSQLVDQNIVKKVIAFEVSVDDNDPTILRASAIYIPVFPLEYIVASLEVRVSN